MTNDTEHGGEVFIIPGRTLRGSKRDMVEGIDQAIVGLLALRHLIDSGSPPEKPAPGGGGRPLRSRLQWPRFLRSLRPMSFGR